MEAALPRRGAQSRRGRRRTTHLFPEGTVEEIRTTNLIERLNEEFRRRVKMQGSLPGEEVGLVLLFSLVAIGQIKRASSTASAASQRC